MNPQLPNSPETPDKLDQILKDDTLIPTSGFAASVMDAITRDQAEKAAFAPIPFPWKLALPTLAAIVIAIVAIARYTNQLRQTIAAHPGWDQINLARLTSSPISHQALPAIAAIAGALLCLLLTRYLALGRIRG